MPESKKSFNAVALGCALAAAALVVSCGGGGDPADAAAVAVYLKASNTGLGDQFGGSVALSGDGNTLAVGAQFEDGGTTGIGSVPTDTAADAGAVYLY